jgi:hypothetical protein
VGASDSIQRDAVFQAVMYFVRRWSRSQSPAYALVVEELNHMDHLAENGTPQQPRTVRFASLQQLGNFHSFIQQHAAVIWGGQAAQVRMHMSIEGSNYFTFLA